MRRAFTMGLVLFVPLVGLLLYFLQQPKDILSSVQERAFSEADYEKGRDLIAQMEGAYGGKERWLGHSIARFVQVADWYGRLKISHWDTLPQRFEMLSWLGTDNAELKLLNGSQRGSIWGIRDGETYRLRNDSSRLEAENERYTQKIVYKNYWFQFPFRIGEAEIIAYLGKETIEGKPYQRVFASWGSESANRQYDQFILYLDAKSFLCEYLYFTVRDAAQPAHLNARFSDFRALEGLVFPFLQEVRYGVPGTEGIRFHENRYENIHLGNP